MDHHDSDSGMMKSHFSKHGDFKGTSIKNVFGGKDYYDSKGMLKGMTMKNVFKGHDYYDKDAMLKGHTIPGMGSKNFIASDGGIKYTPKFLHSDDLHSMRSSLLGKIR